MSAVVVAATTGVSRSKRIDAEFYASPLRHATASMFSRHEAWLSIEDISEAPTSGATPKGHDYTHGSVPFVTIDGIEPLWLDSTRSKRVTSAHRDGELRRVNLRAGDVVVTIKRRICNAAVVYEDAVGSVVNQDVAVLRPTGSLKPEVIAAVLVSRVGQNQARLLQTEQINPYLSVSSLKELRFPILDDSVVEAVVDVVRERHLQLNHAEAETRSASKMVAEACGLTLSASGRITTSDLGSVRGAHRLDAEFFTQPALAFRGDISTTTLSAITTTLSNGATPAAGDYTDDGLPIFKVGGLSRFGVADWRGARVRPDAPAAKASRAVVESGDVLILAAAHDTKYIGKSAVVQELPSGEPRCRVVGELIIARPSPEVNGPTLSAYLNVPAVRAEVQRLVRGQSAHLYPSDLGTLPVPRFQDDLQDHVVRRFDACRAARVRSIECLQEAKGLVEQAVLGGG